MTKQNHVVLGSAGTVGLPPPGREVVGVFQLHPRGFGFIVPDSPIEHGDLFVPPGRTGSALTGDHVRARVIHQQRSGGPGRSPYTGVVVEVIQRANRHFTGNLRQRGRDWIVEVDSKLLHSPVVIRDPHAKNAQSGNKVVVELIEYPTDDAPGEGVITEVLGETGEPNVETVAVMRTYGLPDHFPETVLEEARTLANQFDDKAIPTDREDLTGKLVCTIDPPDAKDFDDAISIEQFEPDEQQDGAVYELGVHIADVSHFVRPGSHLDQEAAARANSVYLPRRVVPMLPELLSNGVCSLQEGVNRYCKSAFVRYDAEGCVLGQRFANTVIRSAKRMTYLEAQAVIDQDLRQARQFAKSRPHYPAPLIAALNRMDELAKAIRTRRLKQGMIVLDLPEVELVFDEHGHVTDAVPQDDAFTHTMIEMLMVEANEAVARLFDDLNVPILRRVHPDPDPTHLKDLRQFTRVAGYEIPMQATRLELQGLLNAIRGKPAQWAVNMAVLRTLSKAEYAPLSTGHFALASEQYAHFTSPIRRYPDLTLHRALEAYLTLSRDAGPGGTRRKSFGKKLQRDDRCPDEQELVQIGQQCSTKERNGESAERDLRTYLVLDLLSHHVGQDFEGTVTGLTNAGIFVQLSRYLVDGFIAVGDLPSRRGGHDRWKLNRLTGALTAQRSGNTIKIGDRKMVRIAQIHPAGRVLELVIVDQPSPRQTENSGRQPAVRKLSQAEKKPRRSSQPKGRKKRKARR